MARLINVENKRREFKKRILSRPIKSLIYLIVSSCTVYAILMLLYTSERQYHIGTTFSESALAIFNWLDYLYYLSYMKVLITIVKYIPQVLLNMKRKSCVGWNIWNILLDITGGILSPIQLVGDGIDLNDLSSIARNSAKLGLSAVSIFFGVSFVLFCGHFFNLYKAFSHHTIFLISNFLSFQMILFPFPFFIMIGDQHYVWYPAHSEEKKDNVVEAMNKIKYEVLA